MCVRYYMERVQSEIVGGLQVAPYWYKRARVEWCGVLSKELKEVLISVIRNSDPVMTIELGLEEMVVNIMCACAPQVGCI